MQSIVTPLEAILTGTVRKLHMTLLASWLKVANLSTVYAVVGSSQVGSDDLVQGQSAVITNADLFAYMDESAYVMRFDYDRRLDEPRGGASYAIGDILLDNVTKRFTPNQDATIGTAIEARRPMKASIQMEAESSYRGVQVIVGLTASRPTENKGARTVEVQLYDYITFIENATIQAAVYEDMRSDQIIEDILVTLGFGSSQYSLDVGINTIPFAWFDKNKSAGRRIRDICEAEEAHFYQDENGILRFENRNHYSVYPHQNVQRIIDSGDILEDGNDVSTRIINRAIVIAKPRKIDAAASVIWTNQTVDSIAHGQSLTIWAAFYDDQAGSEVLPIKDITTPAATTDYVGNTQADGGGADRTASLSLVVTNFVESAKIVITNNHATDTIYLTTLQLRGKAARVTQAIQAIEEDAGSINKFEAQEYVLENNLIQSKSVAETIAANLVARYKDPLDRRILKIPGIPHLQLKDLVSVMNPITENLIPNPGFEGGTTNWSINTAGGAAATLAQDRSIAVPDGSYLGLVTVTSVGA